MPGENIGDYQAINQEQPYGDFPLRLLGTDAPYRGDRSDISERSVSEAQNLSSIPSNLPKLNELSYQQMQNSAKAISGGIQQANMATEALTKAGEAANNMTLPAAEARARINTYQPNQTPQYLESMARQISAMVQSQNQTKQLKIEQQQKLQEVVATQLGKQMEENQKKTQESQYTNALLEMSDHVSAAEEKIKDTTGVAGFRQQSLAIIAKYPQLDEADKQKLITDSFSAERRVTDKLSTEAQKQITEVNQSRNSAAKADFGLAMTGQISALQNGFITTEQFEKNLNDNIKTYAASHPELDTRDLMEIQTAQMEAAQKSALHNANTQNQLLYKQQQAQGFLKDIQPFYEQYQTGKITEAQFQMHEAVTADKYGVPRNLVPALDKPDAGLQEVIRRQELQNKMNTLSQQGAIQDEQKQAVDTLYVGYLVSLLKGTAGMAEQIKANPVIAHNPNWARALGVYEDTNKAETKLTELANQYDTYNKAINAELAGGIKGDTTLPGGITLQAIPQDLQLTAGKQLTPEQQAALQQLRQNNIQTIQNAMRRNMQEQENLRAPLRVYGWDNGLKSWNETYQKFKDHIDYVNKAASIVQAGNQSNPLPPTPNAPNPNFNYQAAPSKLSLMTATYQGRKLTLPFLSSTTFQGFTDGYGSPGNGNNEHHDHFHRGLDLAAPEGTWVQAHGYGVVKHSMAPDATSGYGNMIDVLYQDGKVVRYGHLHGRAVNEGDEVFPGEVIGSVGHTGHATGPHLHFEVRRDAEFTDEGSLDPVQYLNNLSNTAQTTGARSNNFDKVDRFNPYQANNQYQLPKAIYPKGAVPIPGGYIIGNKIVPYHAPTDYTPAEARGTYNQSKPLNMSAAPTRKADYGANQPEANYGYGPIARDKQFARKITDVSNKLGIPGAWLADIMAFETGNTFNPADDNGVGYGGLIGFGDDDAKGFGLHSRYDLFKMDRIQQMDYVYKYLAPYKDQLTDVQSVLATVFGGGGMLKLYKQDPQKALSQGDGYIKLYRYLQRLGEGAGRRYAL